MICSATDDVIKMIGRICVEKELKGWRGREEVSSTKEKGLRDILVKNFFACIWD